MKPVFHFLYGSHRIAFIVALFFCFQCSDKIYITKEFSFPPKRDNWKYKGTITISSRGNPDERNRKTVKIVVKDKEDNVVLDDSMMFTGVEIDARVTWKKSPHIKVVVREKGNKGANDEYNKKLVKRGPRVLTRTNYWFDSTKGKFR